MIIYYGVKLKSNSVLHLLGLRLGGELDLARSTNKTYIYTKRYPQKNASCSLGHTMYMVLLHCAIGLQTYNLQNCASKFSRVFVQNFIHYVLLLNKTVPSFVSAVSVLCPVLFLYYPDQYLNEHNCRCQ